MPMFVKMGNGGTGFLGAPASSKRAMARRLRRRESVAGFPWDGKFQTREEIDRYLSGDKIDCLLCGRGLKSLGVHLLRIHGINEEKYKERFGLPWGRGLVCKSTFENYSRHVKSPENLERLRANIGVIQPLAAAAINHRPFAPFIRDEMTKRINAGRG